MFQIDPLGLINLMILFGNVMTTNGLIKGYLTIGDQPCTITL